jgi:hypothetical protein
VINWIKAWNGAKYIDTFCGKGWNRRFSVHSGSDGRGCLRSPRARHHPYWRGGFIGKSCISPRTICAWWGKMPGTRPLCSAITPNSYCRIIRPIIRNQRHVRWFRNLAQQATEVNVCPVGTCTKRKNRYSTCAVAKNTKWFKTPRCLSSGGRAVRPGCCSCRLNT